MFSNTLEIKLGLEYNVLFDGQAQLEEFDPIPTKGFNIFSIRPGVKIYFW